MSPLPLHGPLLPSSCSFPLQGLSLLVTPPPPPRPRPGPPPSTQGLPSSTLDHHALSRKACVMSQAGHFQECDSSANFFISEPKPLQLHTQTAAS